MFEKKEERIKKVAEPKAKPAAAAVIEAMPDALLVLDLDGNIVNVNPAFAKLSGREPKEFIGKSFADAPDIIPEEIEKGMKLIREVLETGKPVSLEWSFRTKDGSTIPTLITGTVIKDSEGNPINFVASLRNITEFKRAEAEKTKALAERAAITDSIPDGLMVVDLKGNVVSMSRVMEETLIRDGLNPKELIGKSAFEIPLVNPEDVEKFTGLVREAIEKGKAGPAEAFVRRLDGSEGWHSFTISVLKDEKGKPQGIIALTTDITELKRLQEKEKERTEDLEKAYEELKTLDTAKSGFISIAAHELKTPLSIIHGYCSLLQDGTLGKLDKIQKEKIGNVVEETERLIKLVEELLDVSAIEVGKLSMKMEKIAVDRIVKKVVSEFKPRANNKKQSIILEMPKKLPLVIGDSNRISTVFYNLVDNAVKYAPENGTIAVKAKEETAHLHFMVTDNGPGIPPKDLEKIFNRFYTDTAKSVLTRKGGGMGLGLSICKGIIEAHQGKIWAESSGKGSTFHVLLPKKKKEE